MNNEVNLTACMENASFSYEWLANKHLARPQPWAVADAITFLAFVILYVHEEQSAERSINATD